MPYVFDNIYLNMELVIPRDGYKPDFAKVKKRLWDKDGLLIDRPHNNTIMDSRVYEVEYKDGNKDFLASNVIAENMFAQVDGEVNRHVLFQEIVVHRYNVTEVKEQDAFITTRNGTKRHSKTTRGLKSLYNRRIGAQPV